MATKFSSFSSLLHTTPLAPLSSATADATLPETQPVDLHTKVEAPATELDTFLAKLPPEVPKQGPKLVWEFTEDQKALTILTLHPDWEVRTQVAMYLDPGRPEFQLLLNDESSHVRLQAGYRIPGGNAESQAMEEYNKATLEACARIQGKADADRARAGHFDTIDRSRDDWS